MSYLRVSVFIFDPPSVVQGCFTVRVFFTVSMGSYPALHSIIFIELQRSSALWRTARAPSRPRIGVAWQVDPHMAQLNNLGI